MASKKITELTNVTSVQDSDLLLVETSEGTRSISKNNFVSDIIEKINEITIPTKLSELTDDTTHRLVTDTEKSAWNAKPTISDVNSTVANAVNTAKVKISTITLSVNNWSGSGTTFTQTITISGATSKSKVDLQPNSTTLNQLLNDGVSAMYIENNKGKTTLKAKRSEQIFYLIHFLINQEFY